MHAAAVVSLKKAPTMKGVGLANVQHYVEHEHGAGAWQRVLESLDAADAHEIATAVAVGWYEVALFARLLRAIDRVCGKGDLRLLRRVGAHEVEQDFNRVLRMFMRVLSPEHIFKAEARLWKHFQDSGEWSSSPVEGGMDATLAGWAADAALCEELAGYLEKLTELAGGHDVRVLHDECRARGASRCVFKYRYR